MTVRREAPCGASNGWVSVQPPHCLVAFHWTEGLPSPLEVSLEHSRFGKLRQPSLVQCLSLSFEAASQCRGARET